VSDHQLRTPDPPLTTALERPLAASVQASAVAVADTPPPLPEKSTSLNAEPQNDYANVGGGGSAHPGANKVPPPVMRKSTHRGRVCIIYVFIFFVLVFIIC